MANWEAITRRIARRKHVDPNLFAAQIGQESNFNPNANSGKALGIAQFTPDTAAGLGIDPLKPRQALRGAAQLMHDYIGKYGVEDALRAYNAGPGNIQASHGFNETNNYVKSILGSSRRGGPSYSPSPVGASSDPVGTTSEPNVFATIAQLNATQPQTTPLQQQTQQGWELLANIANQRSAGAATEPSPSAPMGGQYNEGLGSIISQANKIDKAHVPYLWGGGHQAQQVSPNAEVTPVDCSGAVSRVLGIDPRVSGDFEGWGKPGEGKQVTIYANGHHVLMKINGRFWGTSASNPGGGAGWIDGTQISADYLKSFTARHPPGL